MDKYMLDMDDERTSNSNSQYEFSFGEQLEQYNVETSAVHRKLQSKLEALRILRQELEQLTSERDQYKLMAETLQLRYAAMKCNSELIAGSSNACGALSENSSLAALLRETNLKNLKLNTEVEALKQRLSELQGDMTLLREREAGSKLKLQSLLNEHAAHNKEELHWKRERANFICHLENLKKKNAQLAFDLKAIIDEKEELITERDAYKCKAHRLNHELLVALKANKMHPKLLDIDAVLLENKYLHERVKIQEGELDLTKHAVSKYKTMLEAKRKKGIVKLSGNNGDDTILSPRQVKTILESGIDLPGKTESIDDLKSLCLALLDNLNDKNLALTHQKKTNKILATKMAELEQRWQQLLSGESESAGIDEGDEEEEDCGYAPSQLLLNGYCPSMVDETEGETETTTTTAAAANAPEPTATKTTTTAAVDATQSEPYEAKQSDDGMSSLSTESADSSVYGVDVRLQHTIVNPYKSSSVTTDSGNYGYAGSGTPCISSTIARERMEDLKDLPPHLAALVQKTLHELDVRDYEAMVAIRAENASTMPALKL
ncbi:CG14868 [Drosophila busckii]|uniref:CG14868 n=1 Tax=Drosophila busckii TaxID=30019 RepID=A0A0M4ETP0_DROBS|nr:coiled-coil domain-containing protein 149 [Drosophila busckii]ALC46267.1 CG14868 [Drosophila busckii]